MPRALNDRSSALTAQNLIALPERFGCRCGPMMVILLLSVLINYAILMLSASRKKPVRISIYCA